MISFVSGNLLTHDLKHRVNAVNCVGVMGAGLAKQFKEHFDPSYFNEYRNACLQGKVKPGRVYYRKEFGVFDFTSKDHWRDGSRIDWIVSGVKELSVRCATLNVDVVGIPPIGCGHGGLSRVDVANIITTYFTNHRTSALLFNFIR